MRSFLLTLISFFTLSCDNSNTGGAAEETTYDQTLDKYLATNNNQSPTFLKFEFGSSKKEAESHIAGLIKEGKLEGKNTIRFTELNFETTGWGYDLFLSAEKRVQTLLDLDYRDGKLYEVSMMPHGEVPYDEIKDFLTTQYGEPSFIGLDTMTKYSQDKMYYWFKNNYEVSYSPGPFRLIRFTDLQIKKKVLRDLRFIDSLSTELKKEATDKTKEDFQ